MAVIKVFDKYGNKMHSCVTGNRSVDEVMDEVCEKISPGAGITVEAHTTHQYASTNKICEREV